MAVSDTAGGCIHTLALHRQLTARCSAWSLAQSSGNCRLPAFGVSLPACLRSDKYDGLLLLLRVPRKAMLALTEAALSTTLSCMPLSCRHIVTHRCH